MCNLFTVFNETNVVLHDKPRHDRQRAPETKRQLQEKEAKRLVLAKAKQFQIGKDTKDKAAKRLEVEKAQIEALIEKQSRGRRPFNGQGGN